MAACARPALKPDTALTDIDPPAVPALYADLTATAPPVSSVQGSARFAASTPSGAERGTIRFSADRHTTLLVFRNSLGIEGYRVLIDSDSVTLYNRIDGSAQKAAVDDVELGAFEGVFGIRLLEVLNPDWTTHTPVRGMENRESWMFWLSDARFVVFGKRDRLPSRYEQANIVVHYEEHASYGGYRFGRRLTVRSRDGRSSVYLLVQSVQPNPVSLDLDLPLPPGTRIHRP